MYTLQINHQKQKINKKVTGINISRRLKLKNCKERSNDSKVITTD